MGERNESTQPLLFELPTQYGREIHTGRPLYENPLAGLPSDVGTNPEGKEDDSGENEAQIGMGKGDAVSGTDPGVELRRKAIESYRARKPKEYTSAGFSHPDD